MVSALVHEQNYATDGRAWLRGEDRQMAVKTNLHRHRTKTIVRRAEPSELDDRKPH